MALMADISAKLPEWGAELGFDALGISSIDLSSAEQSLWAWLAQGYQGDMEWMQRHGTKRSRPAELVEGTLSIISVRMNYWPEPSTPAEMVLNHPELAYISRYALGRDYHKVLRQRLEKLAERLQTEIGFLRYRVFVDSAPVLEKPIAVKAGLGWLGKHTNLIHRSAGSYFFLGELYTDLPLPETGASTEHCGSCTACLDICPTQAIIQPYLLDANRCISYLSIEYAGSIPLEFRPLMGNRIYGCDDCQLICPWNRFAQVSTEYDFQIRHQLDRASLLELFAWDETTFLAKLAGTAIRRIGHERWLRNLAIALGNAPPSHHIRDALLAKLDTALSPLVREHVEWALQRQT
ncbi:epoxyqueuosine reductase [Thiothrix eikelboomii]|uniref:Epoxyqueuosine reductase n=1 Tax=Thiothrix eikelboomii TaxID=92487 RepID=A0A1T4XDM7_9GAMM|nr:epoxyqueuosine reductase [Thiothrix eikelboomii]